MNDDSKQMPNMGPKSFGEQDFDMPISTREYLQARALEEAARLKINTKNAITIAVMYIVLVIGLFGMLVYVRHIQDVNLSNMASIASERNGENVKTKNNLIQLCNFMKKMVQSHEDTMHVMISDPIFAAHPHSAYTTRLKQIKDIKATFDSQLVPACT